MTARAVAATRTKMNSAPKRPTALRETIRRHLTRVPEIDAVYLWKDDGNVVHVFSVVREFQDDIYKKLIPKEHAIERMHPRKVMEFHVRAHQGRKPEETVPHEAELVYARC